ncbi:Rieske 2Fe-2S domain-containing protein [Hansschlegelia beijingensis]|uniref:Rieske 2Fe-2S domain-containing protein n=1 Tax=Hansschlegelia beijingensis TaxID=1133344 RepID=UPI00387EFE56
MTASDDLVWEPLDDVADLEVGDRREVSLASGKLVLVMRTEDGLHASCADCPHQDAPLAEGMLDGSVLTCPVHFWQWDVTTGEPLGVAELPLEIFQLRQEGGRWLIGTRP